MTTLQDLFHYVEETSTGNYVTSETRQEVTEHLNNLIEDLILDNEEHKTDLITDVNNDDKIISGINNFLGNFIKVEHV